LGDLLTDTVVTKHGNEWGVLAERTGEVDVLVTNVDKSASNGSRGRLGPFLTPFLTDFGRVVDVHFYQIHRHGFWAHFQS